MLILLAGTGFLGIFISGFWLSKLARPLNAILLAFHKIISLLTLALFVLAVCRGNLAAKLSALEWTTAGAAALFFLLVIVTGGVLSTNKTLPPGLLVVHRLFSGLTLVATAGFFLLNR